MWMIWAPLAAVAGAVVVTSALIAAGLYGDEGLTFLDVIGGAIGFEAPVLVAYFLAGLPVALIARLLPRRLPFPAKVTIIGFLGVSIGIVLTLLIPPVELSIRDSGVHFTIIYAAGLVGLLSWKRAGNSQ